MDKKTIGYIVLAIALGAILYTYNKPAPEVEEPAPDPTKSGGGAMGLGDLGGLLGSTAKDLGKNIAQFVSNLLSGNEARRYSDLYNSWITNNNFKVSNGQGFGDFVKGKMKPAYFPELEQELNDYKNFVANPSNFKPGTHRNVIRRYQAATREALRLVRLTIKEYTQNAN